YRKVINGYFSNYSNRHISALKGISGDYYMETFPVLMSIEFEQNMTKAVLNIDGFRGVWEEFYLKKNGKWEYFDQPKQFWEELNK
ncbi:MAG: hypothetical protein KKD38_03890, partial [Candidatus Delongbacteria bacterium]|nr:hypothetical protein [Candidatus Delongbacteria bacterium]MCG2760971.1 hypothetical protein [Candidatus Delongbacteria bacterium]